MNKPIIAIVFASALVISSTVACTTCPPAATPAPTHLPAKPTEPATAAFPRPSELPEPTITSSPTPPPDSPCSLVDTWAWSPDGQFGAASVYSASVNVDWPTIYARDGRCARFDPPNKWGWFEGWTSDSQYAIFIAYDQYGNTHTAVFDTHAWAPVDLPDSLECMTGITAPYYNTHPCHTVAIAPITPRILFAHGVILDLKTLSMITITEMISGTMPPDGYDIEEAAWSPHETQLAFFTSKGDVVCVTNGDGTRTRQVFSLPSHCTVESIELTWSNEQRLIVSIQGEPFGDECNPYTEIVTTSLP